MKILKISKFLTFLLIMFSSSGCSRPINENNEIVMCEGMKIEVDRASDSIVIGAYSPTGRSYKTNDVNVQYKLYPRDMRWYGSLGLYRPSGNGNIHVVLEEGHQYFSSQEDAITWLKWQDDRMAYVYTSDGLVIGWNVVKSSSDDIAFSSQIWQFYINGRKPVSMPGSSDAAIKVNDGNSNCSDSHKPTSFVASKAKNINGRVFSGKSLDYMNEMEISSQTVELAIENGQRVEKKELIGYYYSTSNGLFLWVLTDKNGKVMLVGV